MYNDANSTVGAAGGVKKFNLMCLIGSLIGATVGYFVGELIISTLGNRLPAVLLVGIYFAQLAFFIFLAALICEKIAPRFNSRIWTKDHWRDSLKRLPLMSLAAFFALGCMFQFFYGLTAPATAFQEADDYIICIDNSGSMSTNDGPGERFSAVRLFVDELDETNNIAVLLFSDIVEELIPLSTVDDELRSLIDETFSGLEPDGGTDIQAALEMAAQIPIEAGRNAMVIMLSDGESAVNVPRITDIYNTNNLVLNTVEFTGDQWWGSGLLLNLATSTGGMNYQIPEMNQLAGTFTEILIGVRNARNILNYRYGFDRASTLHMVLRVLFIALIGVAICVALAVMLYNTTVMKKLLLCKIVTGLLAGIVLEYFLYNFSPAPMVRLAAVLLLGLLVSTFSASAADQAYMENKNLAHSGNSKW